MASKASDPRDSLARRRLARNRPVLDCSHGGIGAGSNQVAPSLGPGQRARAHPQSRLRVATGQSSGANPWVRNKARVIRSRPNPSNRMRNLTVGGDDPERPSEVVEVAVGRGDRGRVLRRVDGRHDLEFECLGPLVLGQDAPDPPKKGSLATTVSTCRPSESRTSARAVARRPGARWRVWRRRRTPDRAAGKTASEPGPCWAHDGNTSRIRRSDLRLRAGFPSGSDERMADGGTQTHIGRLERRGPVTTRLRRSHQPLVGRIVTREGRHRPDHVGE